MDSFFGFSAHAFDISTVYKPAGDFTNVGEFVSDILVFLVSAAGVIAFIFIIIAGLKYVTSSGDQKKLDSARSTLTFSVIGITVVILSFVIIRFVQAFVGTNINLMGGGDSGSGLPPSTGARCGLASSSVVAGANLGFGYDGFTAGQKIFIWDGGVNRVDLGTTLSGPQLVSFTIPSSTPPGNYGGFIENVPNPSVPCDPVTITAPVAAPCPHDYNGDGVVSEADVIILLGYFGFYAPAGSGLAIYDLNSDGVIDNSDALILAGEIGTC